MRRQALFHLGELLDLRAIPAVRRLAADGSPETMYLARKLLALYEAKKPESKALIRPAASAEPASPAQPWMNRRRPVVLVSSAMAAPCAPQAGETRQD